METKFRAWDKDASIFTTPPEYGEYIWQIHPDKGIEILAESTEWKEEGGDPIELSRWAPIDCDITLYSGEKDILNVEIYEKDFVLIEMGNTKVICLVEFKNGGFLVESNGFFGTEEYDVSLIGWAIDEMDSVKVIGNIYQNPELLDKIL